MYGAWLPPGMTTIRPLGTDRTSNSPSASGIVLVVFAPQGQHGNRDSRQAILVGLDLDGGHRDETGEPLGMLGNQRKGKATAHRRGQQHRTLDLELVEKPGQPAFRQLLAGRRLAEARQVDGERRYPADAKASSVPICCQVADEKLAPWSRTTGLPSFGPATR